MDLKWENFVFLSILLFILKDRCPLLGEKITGKCMLNVERRYRFSIDYVFPGYELLLY